jgi:hypothetical protein
MNYPSDAIRPYFVDEGDQYTLNAYFFDPTRIFNKFGQYYPYVGESLYIKGDNAEEKLPLDFPTLSSKHSFWTKGKCLNGVGQLYFADVRRQKISENSTAANLFPVGLIFNDAKLIGFMWSFNAVIPDGTAVQRFSYVKTKDSDRSFTYSVPSDMSPVSTNQYFFFDNKAKSIVC